MQHILDEFQPPREVAGKKAAKAKRRYSDATSGGAKGLPSGREPTASTGAARAVQRRVEKDAPMSQDGDVTSREENEKRDATQSTVSKPKAAEGQVKGNPARTSKKLLPAINEIACERSTASRAPRVNRKSLSSSNAVATESTSDVPPPKKRDRSSMKPANGSSQAQAPPKKTRGRTETQTTNSPFQAPEGVKAVPPKAAALLRGTKCSPRLAGLRK